MVTDEFFQGTILAFSCFRLSTVNTLGRKLDVCYGVFTPHPDCRDGLMLRRRKMDLARFSFLMNGANLS